MKKIRDIVLRLNRGERGIISNYCHAKLRTHKSKKYQLLALLINGNDWTEEEMLLHLYGNKKRVHSFRQLKTEVREELMSLLLIQPAKSKYQSPKRAAAYTVKRDYLFAELLYAKGLGKQAKTYINRALKKAEEYNLIWDQIQCYERLRIYDGFRYGLPGFAKMKNLHLAKLEEYRVNTDLVNKQQELVIPFVFHVNKDKTQQEVSAHALNKIEEAYQNGGAPEIGYLYYNTKVHDHFHKREYAEAKEVALQFLDFLAENPSVDTGASIPGTNMQLATISLNLSKFKEAEPYIAKAIKGFASGKLNQLNAMMVQFYCLFRQEEYAPALELCNKALKHPSIGTRAISKSIWHFFKVACHYQMNNHEKAFYGLHYCNQLMEDKTGWQMGYRLLQILISLDEEEGDQADYYIENFVKLLQRQKDSDIERIRLILKLLTLLRKYNNDFKKLQSKHGDLVDLLKTGQGAYHWDPVGYEIIRFDSWLESRLT